MCRWWPGCTRSSSGPRSPSTSCSGEGLDSEQLRALRLLNRAPDAHSDGVYLAHLDLIARAAGRSGRLARLVKIADLQDRCLHPRVRADGWSPPYARGLALPRTATRQSQRRVPIQSTDQKGEPGMTTQAFRRSGWVTFAAIVALVVGAYDALSGLSTLTTDYPIIERAHDVLFNINVDTWGWFWLIIGALQLLTGFLLLARNPWGRWLGIIFAGVSAIMAVFSIFAWPAWAFSVLLLDVLVLYALTTHGEEFGG
jgi:hypothetical protein